MSPAVSKKQQRYLASKFGPDWLREHHFDKVKPKKKPVGKKRK